MAVLFRRPSLRAGPLIVPTEPVEIDWEHPLALGIVGFWLPGLSLVDLSGNAALGSFAGPPVFVPSVTGPALLGVENTNGFAVIPNNAALEPANALTFEFGFLPPSAPHFVWENLVAKVTNGGNTDYGVFYNGGALNLYFQVGSSANITSAPITVGEHYVFAGVYDGADTRSYLNGALASTPTSMTGAIPYGGNPLVFLDNASLLPANSSAVQLDRVCVRNVAISASQAAWLAAEPFAMLRPKVRRRYYIASGGTIYNETISESGAATDNYTAAATMRPTITEAASGADAWSATAVFNAADAESASATDAYAAVMSAVVAFTESGSASDALAVAITFVAAVGETGTAADAWTVANVIAEALAESGAALDAVSAVATMNATLAEAASAVDNYAIPGTNTFIQLVARMAQTPRAPHGFV